MEEPSDPASFLQMTYDTKLTDGFQMWVAENTVCLEGSVYPSQVAATVSRYLFYSNNGVVPVGNIIWRNIFKPKVIEGWLKEHVALGKGPSCIYNYVCALEKASTYCYTLLDIRVPEGFIHFLQRKKRLYGKQKRCKNAQHIERQCEEDLTSLEPLINGVVKSADCLRRFACVVNRAGKSLQGKGPPLCRNDYLFAMRFAMIHMVISMGLRASVVYTLSTAQVSSAKGDWKDTKPVIIKNMQHKTGSIYGSARIVLSKISKDVFCLYFKVIRPAAIESFRIGPQSYVFFNTAGNRLNASMVTVHLKALQRRCNIEAPYNITYIRKFISTSLRPLRDVESADSVPGEVVATGLSHSIRTNDTHYRLHNRDATAITFHNLIVGLFRL